MKKIIILSEQHSFIRRPISHDAILGQEKEFLACGKDKAEIRYKSFLLKYFNRITSKFGLKPLCDPFTRKKEDGEYLYIAMHLDYLRSNLYLLKRLQRSGNKIALYVWDCWQPEYDDWQKVLDDLKADHIFFSFKQTYDHFKDRYNCFWIPQSANRYAFKPLDVPKTRLFLQMGRVNKPMHEAILDYLKEHGLEDVRDNYAYRAHSGEVLFPELDELVRQINLSKYLVCIPKCYENPKRTGDVCAMTGRYYEAIVCKTMIIGKKPLVFDELFPEDGMVEFKDDLSDFTQKIDSLENDPEEYRRIVENNYKIFIEKHSWTRRLEQMLAIINDGQRGVNE